MNKKRKSEIADLVKSGKTPKAAYEATKKGGKSKEKESTAKVKPAAKTVKKAAAKKTKKKE